MLDLSQLSNGGRTAVAVVKEGGVVLVCLVVAGFYLGQTAGWIPDVERETHRTLKDQHTELRGDVQAQTLILKQNQDLLARQLDLMERNQKAQMRLTRGLCISITKTSDAERRCLGDD